MHAADSFRRGRVSFIRDRLSWLCSGLSFVRDGVSFIRGGQNCRCGWRVGSKPRKTGLLRPADGRKAARPAGDSFQPAAGPSRIAAAVEHSVDVHGVAGHGVVDGERETLGQTPMLAEKDRMNPGIELQRITIGEQTIEEVITETGFLFFVEVKPGNQILPGVVVNLNSHDTWRRMSDLADSHAVYPAWPSPTRF